VTLAAGIVFAAEGIADDPLSVQITSGPSGTITGSDASFSFVASDGSTNFQCSLDGAVFEFCTSPQSYSALSDGSHFFTVIVSGSQGGSEAPSATRDWTVQNRLPCTDANEPTNFPVYSLGESIAGHDVSSVIRRCDEPQPDSPGRANFVSYTYGVCPELADGTVESCPAPLEIQSWPGCERTLSDYELKPGTPYPHDNLGQLAGVPAYAFDGGTRVELYTGTATIVIFSQDPNLIDQAVTAIEREPASTAPSTPAEATTDAVPLPDPVPGAMAGDLSCA
jgi:hypothetical protein